MAVKEARAKAIVQSQVRVLCCIQGWHVSIPWRCLLLSCSCTLSVEGAFQGHRA
jgi:hypothetical protein